MSPSEPSVRAGQKTGISFCARMSFSGILSDMTNLVAPIVHALLVVNLLP